jgi:hypothetical protein
MFLKKTATIAVMLTVPQTAIACHHYSQWYYPWKQTCNTGHPIVVTRFIPKEPTQVAPLLAQENAEPPKLYTKSDIEILNVLLQTNSEFINRIPDIPVDVLFTGGPVYLKPIEEIERRIGEDEIIRMKGIEELKERMKPLPTEKN